MRDVDSNIKYYDIITFVADVLKKSNATDNFDIKFGAAVTIFYQYQLSGDFKQVMDDIDDAIQSSYNGTVN